jgi:hypothetical protein
VGTSRESALGPATTESPAIETVTGTRPMVARSDGDDGIHGGRAQHRHSHESGNPVLLSEPELGLAMT